MTALLFSGCDRRETPDSSDNGHRVDPSELAISNDELLQLQLPALPAKGRKLIDVIQDVNRQIADFVSSDPRGGIVIVRHPTKIDNGDKLLGMDLPAAALGKRLNDLSAMTLALWTISENGYLVFRTWHRPQYDFDAVDGTPDPDNNGEPGGSVQQDTDPEPEPAGKEKPQPESEALPR
ncbi:MAG: hypothetical protein V4584_17850 [Verrucomicrobiota bacterium]